METLKTKKQDAITNQDVKLIEGYFTLSEARDIINSILDVKINFHKLQRLSRTEGNENDACEYDNSRINELISAKHNTKEFLNDNKFLGKKIKIESTITIQIED